MKLLVMVSKSCCVGKILDFRGNVSLEFLRLRGSGVRCRVVTRYRAGLSALILGRYLSLRRWNAPLAFQDLVEAFVGHDCGGILRILGA